MMSRMLAGLFLLLSVISASPTPSKINVRLVKGPDSSEGILEIQSGDGDVGTNPWGTICNDEFEKNNNAATVICRQLGYFWGEATDAKNYDTASVGRRVYLVKVACNGTESSIRECSHLPGWGIHGCSSHGNVAAICHNKPEIQVRLVNGKDASQGRVEIQKVSRNVEDNPWGTICNDQYEVNNKAATVICRQLGYVWGEGTPNGMFGSGSSSMPIYLDELMCNGSETSIAECHHSGWAKHNCYHHEDVGAICHNTTVRLTTPSSQPDVGVVQVMHGYAWGDVCDKGWNDAAATLTCLKLGYVSGKALCCSALGTPYPSISNMSFTYDCDGTEAELSQCTNTSYKGRCDAGHRASVTCHNTTLDNINTSFAIRIVNGSDNWGRVEVRHSGVWGLVCNNRWTDSHANVTCRQLDQGFAGGIAFGPVAAPKMPYWLVYLECMGQEGSLENCSFRQWGEPRRLNSQRCQPAYVLCYRDTGIQVDIVGGVIPSVGRVQITYDGVPGSLCTEEWSHNDAFLVCRMKGYADGMVKTPDPASRDVPPYYLNRMICPNFSSIFMCRSYGWRVNTDTCTESAHVKCFMDVRLSGGSESAGIVEIREKGAWAGLCYLGFEPSFAKLVCLELGYSTGSILPMGAYGKYYGNLARPYLMCKGNEASLKQCDYNKQVQCVSINDHYVAVSCHHDEPEEEVQFQLFGETPDSNYGRIDIRMKYVWGEICADEWRDMEAEVFCKTLERGFIGGVAVAYVRRPRVPTLVKRITCKGDEKSFANCTVVVTGECMTPLSAGALCYRDTAPYLSLVEGGSNFGRVQLSSDGVSGSVCDFQLTRVDATVICKEINSNFTEGEPYNDFPVASGEVVLSNVVCSGLERSLLKCVNSGWRYVTSTNCLDHSHDVGVYCYGKVRITGGKKTRDYAMGRVEIWDGDSDSWISVCGEGFDRVDADTVCHEMGFDAAKVLAPGSFGVKSVWKFYTNMSCSEGGTDVRRDCTYENGRCMVPTHNYASVLCHKQGADPEQKVYIENEYNGMVIVEQFGINGTVCVDGWNNKAAGVICKEKGFRDGVVLGVKEMYTRSSPVLMTNVTCTGSEGRLGDCPYTDNVGLSCAISLKAAGVLCYKQNQGVKIELVNDNNENYYGRVEIAYDNERGTVCDYDWSTYDARVLCRELGFVDGQAYRKSYYGPGKGPTYLSGLTCDSTETSLLACPNQGWRKVQSICKDHDSDASVKCKRNVLTVQAPSYGAVAVWQDGAYYHECSDNFNSANAGTICRTMGYSYGKAVCCSVFGQAKYKISTTVSKCSGREWNYNDCEKTVGQRCDSQQYTTVVCTNTMPQTKWSYDIQVSIENYQPSMGSGPVIIRHYSTNGYICAENFDDNDANVVCKEAGYVGGYAYKYYNEDVRNGATNDLHWMPGPDCTGTERRLEECPGIKLGNVQGCFILSHAAVFCYRSEEQSKFEVRLMNSPHPGEGFVQVKVNGTWGSVCTRNTRISNFEATVICRQKNFKYGVELSYPDYPPLNSSVWLTNVNCVGNETSLKDCLLTGMGSQVSTACNTHQYDMAVKCYANVRVSASKLPNYGMVQVLNETSDKWVSVCDTDFDDDDARVVCRNIGYKDGKAQCCSSMGKKLTFYNPIQVANVQCTGEGRNFSLCKKDMGPNVTCQSGTYASVICTDTSPPVENMKVAIAEDKHYGNVVVERFGIKGAVCGENWSNTEARVLCRQLGFMNGFATNGTNRANDVVILTSVQCTGTESSLDQCTYPGLSQGHGCGGAPKRAAVVCSMDTEPIQYRLADVLNGRGRAEIYFNGQWGTICDKYWEDEDADVFCQQAGYLYGESTFLAASGKSGTPIWMSHVECSGAETSFFQCQASWDASTISRCTHFDDAGVICYNSVQLNRGDYRSKRTNGIVQIYVPQNYTGQFGVSWYTVCADTFTDKEAEVACQVLGHDHGMAVCCSPYGYSTTPMTMYRPKCLGTEKQITECQYVANDTKCSRQNYAAVTCYNGTKPSDSYSLELKGSLGYTGQVVLSYLGVPGRVCWTGWDDADARVVCREMGFKNGSAYYHYKSSFIYLDYNGPYWLSNVNCTGTERQLGDCAHSGFGNVSQCEDRGTERQLGDCAHSGFGNVSQCEDRGHYAGVICYDDSDVAYRISGGNARYGRVEFSYKGEWNTICSSSWGYQEANVTCRQLGYITGDTYSGDYTSKATGRAYTIDFRCKGREKSLNECPHEGIQESLFCDDHKDDEGVFCYTNVKLSGAQGMNSGNGTVLYYHNDRWSLVCDEGFDDVTARKVCQELGFQEGRAICCSAYGKVFVGGIIQNYTLHCEGDEETIDQCLVQRPCNSSHYASVVCFKDRQDIDEETYTFSVKGKDSSKGQVAVSHLGVTGRICSRDWDDRDAMVLCRTKNYRNGVSYQHSETTVLQESRGPYWLAEFKCTGNETSLMDCPHSNRTDLGNCTGYDIASVLCFNESGIEYRMVSEGKHYGRVEISVGGVWGTICDRYWDRREARVFCRQLNFTDGEPMGGAHFGQGKGPIWLSHLECNGSENALHQCPHRGFANQFTIDWWFPLTLPCQTHNDDAGVFCYRSVRFNNGPNTNAGGLEVFDEESKAWYGVCDTDFDNTAALVACRSIKDTFVDARPIPGSAYGNISGSIKFTKVKCQGSEKQLTECQMDATSTCASGHYVSIHCSNNTIVDRGVQLRLATDTLASSVHGIIEVQVGGIWGRVCLHNFNDTDASVACRHFGYDGGVAYLHIMKNDRPVLMTNVECTGSEKNLTDCKSQLMVPDLEHCHYASNDAGVICNHKKNEKSGFKYRLAGGPVESVGRVEIGYDDVWGMVCSWSWQTADAKVLCRALGYKDGIVNYTTNSLLKYSKPWVTGFFCQGDEPTPMTCLNTGFNSTFLMDLCQGRREKGAYTQCFQETIEPYNITLVGGPDQYSGRVEIFMKGANSWGTICDDYWDDEDASVVCRHLGYYGGKAVRKAGYGQGTGPIWFDNVKCYGNESTLFDCIHRGIGTHNCNHTEDVGVICQATAPTIITKPTTAASTSKSISTARTTLTTTTTTSTTTTPTTTTTTVKSTTTTTTRGTTSTTSTTKGTTPKATTTTQSSEPPSRSTTSTSTTASTANPSVPPSSTTSSTARATSSTARSTSIAPDITTQNQTIALESTASTGANLGLAVGVPVALLLILAVIVAAVMFMRFRRRKRPGYSQQNFDNSIVSRDTDGSVGVSNQLYDLNLQPVSASGLEEPSPGAAGDKMRLTNNGGAYYSKGMNSNRDETTGAFTNPLYDAAKEMDKTDGVNGVAQSLPASEEISFPDSRETGGMSNA